MVQNTKSIGSEEETQNQNIDGTLSNHLEQLDENIIGVSGKCPHCKKEITWAPWQTTNEKDIVYSYVALENTNKVFAYIPRKTVNGYLKKCFPVHSCNERPIIVLFTNEHYT